MMCGFEEQLVITTARDVVIAQERAREVSRLLGFSRRGQWEIAVAVSEAVNFLFACTEHGVVTLTFYFPSGGAFEFDAAVDGEGRDFDSVPPACAALLSRMMDEAGCGLAPDGRLHVSGKKYIMERGLELSARAS